MAFTSFPFLVFFGCFFLIYYLCARSSKAMWQNMVILLGSYFFYGFTDIRMVPLLLCATIVFYFIGIGIEQSKEKISAFFNVLGIVLGVSLLVYFKYLNFFIESFAQLFNNIGLNVNYHTFKIIMPLGLSFFTFKLISYCIELYRGTISATRDFIAFSSYIAFFPTIVSGPIDRPQHFLPQLNKVRRFDYAMATDGCKQVLWGLLKKMLIADSLAIFVNDCWSSGFQNQSTLTLVAIMLLYPLQMYMDFSGYSDMAIGIGKIMGMKVAKNFKYPFFGRNIAEFWRNWHMSLTSWMTDYIFIPLSLSWRKWKKTGTCLAIFVTFVLVGLWHGANWTYVVYGSYHGLLFVPLMISGAFTRNTEISLNRKGLPKLLEAGKMLLTYLLVAIGLIIFGLPSMSDVCNYFTCIFTNYSLGGWTVIKSGSAAVAVLIAVLIIVYEWFNRKREYAFHLPEFSILKYSWVRCLIYALLVLLVYFYAPTSSSFIYAQF